MNSHSFILAKINPQYFWDVDVDRLHDSNSKRLIIDRVFSLGTLDEMKLLVKHYGKSEVIKVIKCINYLDPKTFNFVTKLFSLPKKELACYIRKQSKLQHWNS
jgi:hypothetical protein